MKKLTVPADNDYVKSVTKSFRSYLIEKATGRSYAELRLQKNLEAAELLHGDALKELAGDSGYYGQWNADNTELVLKNE